MLWLLLWFIYTHGKYFIFLVLYIPINGGNLEYNNDVILEIKIENRLKIFIKRFVFSII